MPQWDPRKRTQRPADASSPRASSQVTKRQKTTEGIDKATDRAKIVEVEEARRRREMNKAEAAAQGKSSDSKSRSDESTCSCPKCKRRQRHIPPITDGNLEEE